ncbi:MAG: Unknown protein [uncultured Sulfurovum sp.]|uniref:Uncharacterized protein n=1 Tax=uncultured Sulfurovum sp. TaxID=269237 RepID=A0A6S6SA08_9BACT|nr:MAG: Unknown protein [uncultured Sulfurovum sp.]
MSAYELTIVIPRNDANTIKADTNYFELNAKAQKIVDDIVLILEENNGVMQELVTDIQNIAPDSTYYTKEAIDERINNLSEAKAHIQLELLTQAKKNTQYDAFVRSITNKIDAHVKALESINSNISELEKRIDTLEALEKDGKILTFQATETLAEFVRNEKNTGIMTVKQGSYFSNDPVDQPIDTRYAVDDIHTHNNYEGMSGMGEYTYNANGYIGQTRHNDYRFFTKSVSFMETVKNEAPSVPNYSYTVENMQNLFQRYLNGALDEDEKELFGWDIVYLESYWLKVESLTGAINDSFESFRHTYGTTSASKLAYNHFKMRSEGKKARFENIPFIPIASKMENSSGETTYAVKMYRILTHRVTDYNGKLATEILEQKDDLVNRARFGDVDYFDRTAKFSLSDNDIDKIVNNIPGLGGLSENIETFKTIDNYDIVTPENKARYHRKYQMAFDAVGRGTYASGWNDPTLIVAHTEAEEIVQGTSYLIPLEMVLRTPLETWNPNDLELKDSIAGNGTLENPYSGMKANSAFYHTPAEFFESYGAGDPADTGTGVKAVTNIRGEVTKNVGSGIYITLPKIDGIEESVRVRFPISWNADEFSPSNIALSAYMKENNEMMDILKLKSLGE